MVTLRVLVVDDEFGMRSGVERALRNYTITIEDLDTRVNFSVTSVDTGEKALDILAQQPPDIILLDHKLPGKHGLSILNEIRENYRSVLTIMITAYASIETAISATKRGAFDFLAKPFTPDELKATLFKAAKHHILKEQAHRLAQEKKQLRFQLISVVSHELKAPLGAIDGYLRIMKDKLAGDNPEAYQNMVERSLIRLDGMRKLIFDLLDLTRIESGQKKRNLQKIALQPIAHDCLETIAIEAKDRGITLEVTIPDTITMEADRGELEIIFNNLLTNAVKYNKENGHIFFTLSEEGENITITCRDTGIGMSTEDVNKLFGEFVRIKNDKTRSILGSGLGLSILKRLVDLYHGTITVNSQEDQGTTFIVHLPKFSTEDQAAQE